MNAELVRDLAVILAGHPEMAGKKLAARLAGIPSAPPVAELLELGARARASLATSEELGLAVGALLACHAPPAGAVAL